MALTAYRRYLLFNRGITGVIITFFIKGFIGVLFKTSVIVSAYRLTIFGCLRPRFFALTIIIRLYIRLLIKP
jgi:hypothetical protein